MTCNAINDPTGNFAQGTAYKGTQGSCSGGKSGTPRRQCYYDGSWGLVSSPCK